MDPIEPWVDRDEVRRLAETLLEKPGPVTPPPNDAVYGEEFVGYAAGGEPEPVPVPVPGPGPASPVVTAPPPVPAPAAPPVAPSGPAPAPAPVPASALAPPLTGAPEPTPPVAPNPDLAPSLAPAEGASAPAPPAQEQNARQALAAAREIAQRGGLLVEPPSTELPPAPPAQTKAEPPSAHAPTSEPVRSAQLTQVSPVPAPAEAAHAVAPVSTPFISRLQAYGTWLREGIRAKAFFVLDRDGGVLIDEVESPKLQQVARTLAQASRTANRQAGAAAIGNLHIKVAPETILEVVPVLTRYGPLILGILVAQPLSPRNVEIVARGLQQVIDGVSGG